MNYLQATARQIEAALPPDAVPDESDTLMLLYALLARAKGSDTTAEDVHDAWTAWMLLRGEDHDSMRPFAELDHGVQAEDEPFLRAIKRAADTSA